MREMREIKIKFADNLKNIRNDLKMSQQEFAEDLIKRLKKYKIDAKYDNKTISNWESAVSFPNVDTLIAISQEYKISLDELFKSKIDCLNNKYYDNLNGNTSLLNCFKKLNNVCTKIKNEYLSSWNPSYYKYGILSYLVDNLINYSGSLSRNFSFINKNKTTDILVCLLDVKDGKRDLHFIGNAENDISRVDNIPSCFDLIDNKTGVLDKIFYNEVINNNIVTFVQLGNGRGYILDSDKIAKYDEEKYKFESNNIPEDAEIYDVDNWIDYACFHENSYCFKDLGNELSIAAYYYPEQEVFAIYYSLELEISDEQLLQILTEDYKHRLIQTLANVSDDSNYKLYKSELEDYEEQENPNKFSYFLKKNPNKNSIDLAPFKFIAIVFQHINQYKSLNEITNTINTILSSTFTTEDIAIILDKYLVNNYDDDFLLDKKQISNEPSYRVIRFGNNFIREKTIK